MIVESLVQRSIPPQIPLVVLLVQHRGGNPVPGLLRLLPSLAQRRPGTPVRTAVEPHGDPSRGPGLAEIALDLAGQRYRSAVVVPVTFSHDPVDRQVIETAVSNAQRTSGVDLRTAQSTGVGEDLLAVLNRRAVTAGIWPDWPAFVLAQSSDFWHNSTVANLTRRWSAGRSGHVSMDLTTEGSLDPQGPLLRGCRTYDRIGIVPVLLDTVTLRAGINEARRTAMQHQRVVIVAEPLGAGLGDLAWDRYDKALPDTQQTA